MRKPAFQSDASGTHAAEDASLATRFAQTRSLTEALASPLSDADATIQSMPDASPAKWHLAHTTWFWETFLLRDHGERYEAFDADFAYLFNSYYEAEGKRHARARRGMLSRPSLERVLDWRAHVTERMQEMLGREELAPLIELGIAHEQQHQELLLMDIRHALFQNPSGPAMFDATHAVTRSGVDSWTAHPGGIAYIGRNEDSPGFAFDNEGPAHRVLLQPFALSDRLVTNSDWDAFIADGGYETARLWLSDGWAWVQEERIAAPLYWREGEWFTLAGWQRRDPDAPVCNISYYEADAFAAWAGRRLPTEFEWEAVARGQHQGEAPAHDPTAGTQLDEASAIGPLGSPGLFGDVWSWTQSAYLPYPRFAAAEGAVGEYNGKFMSGQFVLRGASCATPRGHSRSTYRNFFYPHQRWQYAGLRLAKDI